MFGKWFKKKMASSQLAVKENKKSIQHKLKRSYAYQTSLEMRKLKNAIKQAENLQNPSRRELYALYKEAARDAEVFAQLRTLRNKIKSSPFELKTASGVADQEKKKLLQQPWLLRYFVYWLDAYFWGHSLVEILFEEGAVSTIDLIPREHVQPWSGMVVFDPTGTKGLLYREGAISKQLIEIGSEEELGLFLLICREVIWKNAARGDWSRYSEKFGIPILSIKAVGNKASELDEKERMAQNFGANSYVILEDEDEVSILETGKTDGYKVFFEQAKYCDEQIAKLIVGQTGTSNEKSFVGSAEVHERILDTFTKALLTDLQFHINGKLLPFLTAGGYPLDGYEFRFSELEEKVALPQKKNLSSIVLGVDSCCASATVELSAPLYDLKKLSEAAIERVHKKKLKAGALDADLWRYNVNQLLKGLEKGAGQSFEGLDSRDASHDLMRKLRRNVYSFAAFKNHHNISDLVGLLKDDDGKLRGFSSFKQMAEQLNRQYNENWLNAEYNSAVANSQMALKWEKISKEAELFPWVQYVAIEDDRTRSAHADLNGVTLRWDDPFWEEFFPPNGWNCRCNVRTYANAKEQRPEGLPDIKEVPPAFRHNPGKDGNLYSEEHPYFKQTTKGDKIQIMAAMRSLLLQEKDIYKDALNLMRGRPQIFKSYPQISKDDAAAIYSYSSRISQQFNLRLRYNRLTDFELYLKESLIVALGKLPPYKGRSYRRIATSIRPDFILKSIETGAKEFVDSGFMSTSYNANWAINLPKTNSAGWEILMEIEGKTGRKIEQFSKKGRIFNKEQNQFEVLFKPGTKFKILSYEMDGQTIFVELKEL